MVRYSCMSVEECLKILGTSSSGLTRAEVEKRLDQDGFNRLRLQQPVSAWKILLNQFSDFIIYLLLFAVVVSLLIGEYGDSFVILIILAMNGWIGFMQELRANRSLEALKNMARLSARVIREGVVQTLDSECLVLGDIICLEAGDRIPADSRVISSVNLQVEESSLTGESEPVPKIIAPLSEPAGLADCKNMVFSSTAVVSGRGRAVVTAVAMETEIGRISELVSGTEEEKTPLQKRLDRFGRNLGLVIIGICIGVFCLSIGRFWFRQAYVDSGVFLEFAFIAISLAVAAVPTALPAVVTIALSIGTRRLLLKNVLVRRLTSVETLGSCDVICSDKTGTLTRNIMTVKRVWTVDKELDFDKDTIESATLESDTLQLLFRIGAVCNNSLPASSPETIPVGNPTELALFSSAAKACISDTAKRLNEVPFDSERKCMSVLVENGDGYLLFTKGAPDTLLKLCSRIRLNSSTVQLSETLKQTVSEAIHSLSSKAMRVIAFAYRESGSEMDTAEKNLVFVGLQAMIDPPREDVIESVRRAHMARIRVIMITGDHRETANAIADQIGISGDIVTGAELDNMDDGKLQEVLTSTNIFARVVPEHKQRIISALQTNGHVVAMTGDGVNDAPALKKADIGIAVGSGTDVAHEAADFVLLDDSFTSIVDAVEEGRGIYENIQKSIVLLLSGNLMEVLIIFMAVLFGFNLPLTALLLLWINLITDGAPALAYSIDPYGEGIMHRPPIPLKEGILPPGRLKLLLVAGMFGAAIGLSLFQLSGGNSNDLETVERARTVVFNYIVLYEMVLVFIIRQNYGVKLFTNGWLWTAVIFSVLIQGVIMYTPLNQVFHVSALNITELVKVVCGAGLFLICLLLFRLWGGVNRANGPV